MALSSYSSWQVGGRAEYFSMPRSVAELKEVLEFALENSLKTTIISGGTNVLISDAGIDGLVICLRAMSGATINETAKNTAGKLEITALAGTAKSELLKLFLRHKLEPALFLAGLPGDVGGGVTMNAGIGEMIRPREFVEITEWVEVFRQSSNEKNAKIELIRIQSTDLHWTYRHCEGWQPGVIVRVGLAWPLEESPDILARVKQANQVRLSKQPLELPSCGSVFINPPGQKAGELIERVGLKGFFIGGAQVSKKHANFIVNTGGAKASDVRGVIDHVQSTVLQKLSIILKTEVIYLGNW